MTYAPSWLDRFTGWIDRIPVPSWLLYALLAALLILVNTAAFWASGSLEAGTFDLALVAEIPIALFFVPFVHYLDNVAEKAFSEFRPLLAVSEDEARTLRYELTTLPRRQGLLAFALGIPLGIASVLGDPAAWGLTGSSSILLIAFRNLIGVMLVSIAITFMMHTLHQLRVVRHLQSLPGKISLLNIGPLHALSLLTARTGVGIAFYVYYVVFVNYGLGLFGPEAALSAIDLLVTALLLLVSVGAFIVPLLGMHDRLAEEKARALSEVNTRIDMAAARLFQQVDSQSAQPDDPNNANLSSLLLIADRLSQASTWPWRPQTLRGFFGAIALPVIVWLITTAIDRLFLR